MPRSAVAGVARTSSKNRKSGASHDGILEDPLRARRDAVVLARIERARAARARRRAGSATREDGTARARRGRRS